MSDPLGRVGQPPSQTGYTADSFPQETDLFSRMLALAAALALLPAVPPAAAAEPTYRVHYHASFDPAAGHAMATINVTQNDHNLRLLDFNAPEARYQAFSGDGQIRREGRRVRWQIPPEGGSLSYRVEVDRKRSDAWDARLTDTWSVMRIGHLFPPARVRSRAGAVSEASLSLDGPPGWRFETPYGPVRGRVAVTREGRRFQRPVGWMAAGDLGTRRDVVAGRRVAITGPRDQGFRRLDMLSFLRWTLPELSRLLPSLPQRILIVGGGRDMWRGALSGPGSLYVHPDRPLISGNATSTLLHELVHVAMTEPAASGDDWIVEGLAEYYSLVVLLRSGGISGERFEGALDWLHDWAERRDGQLADPSTGPDTARAVGVFRDLELELAGAGASLDAVTTRLFAEGRVSRRRMAALLEEALGRESAVFAAALERAPAGRARSG